MTTYRNKKGQFTTFSKYKEELGDICAHIEIAMENSEGFKKFIGIS